MPVQIGSKGQPGFDEPFELMMDCHRRIEHFLAILERVVDRSDDGPLAPAARSAVEAALRYFRHAAPKHTADEEESLLPRLRELDDPSAKQLLDEAEELEAEHRHAEKLHASVDGVFVEWIEAEGISPEKRSAMQRDLESLRSLYQRHIAFEDQELFPRAAAILTAKNHADIGREMAARRDRAPDSLHQSS
jgi:hemerythrin-like domain-containing protein